MNTSREELIERGKNTQFKKGVSGNPKGQPKKIPALREIVTNVLGDLNNDGISAAEGILMAQRAKAIKGDTKAAEFCYSYAGYKKANQGITLEGDLNFRVPAPNVYNTAPPLSHSENEIDV